jgi:hypothetical protein
MVTRDFDAYLAEKAGVRPTFRIGGQVFTLRTKLAYAKWTKILASMRSDDVSPEEANDLFFRAVLIRSDVDRFMQLLNNEGDDDEDSGVIGMQEADALVDWAMAHFTGKALNTSDGSSPGSNGTGPQPNVISLSSKAPANAS